MLKEQEKSIYFSPGKISEKHKFCQAFEKKLNQADPNRPLVFLCIGSDRATGDSLGPIIGHKLAQNHFSSIYIYGTLEEPVHAKNLEKVIDTIYDTFSNPYIVAIDACLGKASHIGYFTLDQGAL